MDTWFSYCISNDIVKVFGIEFGHAKYHEHGLFHQSLRLNLDIIGEMMAMMLKEGSGFEPLSMV